MYFYNYAKDSQPMNKYLTVFLVLQTFCFSAAAEEILTDRLTPETTQELIDRGINLNQSNPDGATILMAAASKNPDPKVIEMMIINGADVNARDLNGNTPILFAAGFNPNPDIIRTLLLFGADINAANNLGATPLINAALNNPSAEAVTVLIAYGADVNLPDTSGITPLLAATATSLTAEERDTSQVIASLLQAGANPHAYYKDARALDYAENNPVLQNTSAIQMLKNAMFNWQAPTAH